MTESDCRHPYLKLLGIQWGLQEDIPDIILGNCLDCKSTRSINKDYIYDRGREIYIKINFEG